MMKKLITTTGLTLLVVCSTAICANYKVANATGGVLSIGPEICYMYYTTPDKVPYSYMCDPMQTGVNISPIKTQDQQISIDAPDEPTKAADPSQGNYGWVPNTSNEVTMILPGSTSQANVNGITAVPSSDWGDDVDTCPAQIKAYSASSMVLVLHAYGTWLTYDAEGTFKQTK